MKKEVLIINDELGTIALGFSRAGYDIRAIYIDSREQKCSDVCKVNWGSIVKDGELRQSICQGYSAYNDIDCIAAKIGFKQGYATKKTIDNQMKDYLIYEIINLLGRIRPKSFLFQCERIDHQNIVYQDFCKKMLDMGYVLYQKKIDTRYVTGYPVSEKRDYIIGLKKKEYIDWEIYENVDAVDYSVEEFLDAELSENDRDNSDRFKDESDIHRNSENCLLCWNKGRYEEVQIVKWNNIKIPLVARGDVIRKIAHREIARLKGIPEEYTISVNSKSVLYTKLMYCPHVQVIHKLASAICVDENEKSYDLKKTTKASQFEKILHTYLDMRGQEKHENSATDFQYELNGKKYYIEYKIFQNNVGIREKVSTLCKKLSEKRAGSNGIFIVGNIVGNETKEQIKNQYNVDVWDVANLLWLFQDFPQLKSEFVSLLSYDVSTVCPKNPKVEIPKRNDTVQNRVDFKERMRKIQPKDDWKSYQELCTSIMKYLFSDNIEFYEEQKSSNDGMYRFDLCGKIKKEIKSEFFETIWNFFETKYVVFEFKNYREEISQREVYTTEKYLYEKALRKVAIIVSRKGSDTNAQKAMRGSLRESGKLIICLSDEDINKMIDMRDKKEDPADYLEALLDDMLMDLEK